MQNKIVSLQENTVKKVVAKDPLYQFIEEDSRGTLFKYVATLPGYDSSKHDSVVDGFVKLVSDFAVKKNIDHNMLLAFLDDQDSFFCEAGLKVDYSILGQIFQEVYVAPVVKASLLELLNMLCGHPVRRSSNYQSWDFRNAVAASTLTFSRYEDENEYLYVDNLAAAVKDILDTVIREGTSLAGRLYYGAGDNSSLKSAVFAWFGHHPAVAATMQVAGVPLADILAIYNDRKNALKKIFEAVDVNTECNALRNHSEAIALEIIADCRGKLLPFNLALAGTDEAYDALFHPSKSLATEEVKLLQKKLQRLVINFIKDIRENKPTATVVDLLGILHTMTSRENTPPAHNQDASAESVIAYLSSNAATTQTSQEKITSIVAKIRALRYDYDVADLGTMPGKGMVDRLSLDWELTINNIRSYMNDRTRSIKQGRYKELGQLTRREAQEALTNKCLPAAQQDYMNLLANWHEAQHSELRQTMGRKNLEQFDLAQDTYFRKQAASLAGDATLAKLRSELTVGATISVNIKTGMYNRVIAGYSVSDISHQITIQVGVNQLDISQFQSGFVSVEITRCSWIHDVFPELVVAVKNPVMKELEKKGNQIFEVTITDIAHKFDFSRGSNISGLRALYQGLECFIPASKTHRSFVTFENMIGTTQKVRVVSLENASHGKPKIVLEMPAEQQPARTSYSTSGSRRSSYRSSMDTRPDVVPLPLKGEFKQHAEMLKKKKREEQNAWLKKYRTHLTGW